MIAYVEGRLLDKAEDACFVLTQGGVGYEVLLPASHMARLPARGESVAFCVSTVVREDALELYGFASFDERRMFEILISLSKVGPRIALGILSLFSPDDLRRLAAADDGEALTQVSGIGRKSAEHIFLELKYKLRKELLPGAGPVQPGKPGGVFRDVLAGLANLGYREEEIRPALEETLKEQPDLDEVGAMRDVLKMLGRTKP